MSKKKGLSMDEKRTKLLEIFYEKRTFFQLKELEKIAPKEKGIVGNSVKEVLDKLVDDGLVDTDKVGTSIYFWAFPSKAFNQRSQKLTEITAKCNNLSQQLAETDEQVNKLRIGREDTAERKQLQTQIQDLEVEKDMLTQKIAKFKDNDPEVLYKLKREAEQIKIAANRWTDNIFSIKTWCRDKFSIESGTFNKQFGIPSNFDYIE